MYQIRKYSKVCHKLITILSIVLIWAVSLAVCFVVFICTIRIAMNLSRHIWPSNRIIVGDITEEGSKEKKWDARFLGRWIRYSSSDKYLISNYRFIEDLNLSAYIVLSKATQEFAIDDLGLQIHGVNVSRLANFIYHLYKIPYKQLTGNFSTQGNKMILTLQLNEQSHVLRTWQFAADYEPAGSNREEQMYELINEAIFALVHYVRLSDKKQRRDEQMNGSNIQLNPKALALYHKGRHHLDEYFRTHRENELELAQEQFRNLTYEAPGYAEGFLLLGMSLAEDRQEANAIELFQRARRLSSDAQKALEIDLMIAKSRLRRYTWSSCIQSIFELDALKNILLSNATGEGGDGTDEGNILIARTFAETAHCYGHLLVFLHSKAFNEAENSLKELLDFRNSAQAASQNHDHPPLVQSVYRAHLINITKAEALKLPSNNQISGGVKARISEVKGYARFRYAQWISPNRDDIYIKECEQAISELEKAEIANPMNYALLQNIGMIYLSRRYDPAGKHLRTSERYYVRSNKLKPKDYYAYQQLALCILRRISSVENIESGAEEIKRGLELVDKAIGFRPESKSLQILRVQFLLMCWLNEEDSNRTNIEKEIETAFQLLEKKQYTEGQQKWSLGWGKVFWLANKLRYSGADNFSLLRQELLGALDQVTDMTESYQATHWIASQIYSGANDLRDEIGKLHFDNRQDLIVSIDPAIQ